MTRPTIEMLRQELIRLAGLHFLTADGDCIPDERDSVQIAAVCIQMMLLIWLDPALMRALLGLSRS